MRAAERQGITLPLGMDVVYESFVTVMGKIRDACKARTPRVAKMHGGDYVAPVGLVATHRAGSWARSTGWTPSFDLSNSVVGHRRPLWARRDISPVTLGARPPATMRRPGTRDISLLLPHRSSCVD